MVLMLKAILEERSSLETITLKYLISSHSFLPNGSDFGDTERTLKMQYTLYTPEDYICVMQRTRKKNPLQFHRMQKLVFKGTSQLEKSIVNRKQNIHQNKVSWLLLHQIRILKSKPFSVFMNTELDENFVEVDVKKRRAGRPKSTVDFSLLLLPLWPNGKPISQTKLDDIASILYLISSDATTFYSNLSVDCGIVDDIDGVDRKLDFTLE